MENNPRFAKAIYDYARPVVTGGLAISCEQGGDIYMAVASRANEPMTMAGTTMRLDFDNGTPNPAGPADKDALSAALRITKELLGLDSATYPQLANAQTLTPARSIGPNSPVTNTSQPQRGFGKESTIHQVGVDYCAHLGHVDSLPPLHGTDARTGADSHPTWVNLKHVEKVAAPDGSVHYEYSADDNPLVPRGTHILPHGGMHAAEALAQHARDLPFREVGYDGVSGFLKLQKDVRIASKVEALKQSGTLNEQGLPTTQTGQAAQQFYAELSDALHKSRTVGGIN